MTLKPRPTSQLPGAQCMACCLAAQSWLAQQEHGLRLLHRAGTGAAEHWPASWFPSCDPPASNGDVLQPRCISAASPQHLQCSDPGESCSPASSLPEHQLTQLGSCTLPRHSPQSAVPASLRAFGTRAEHLQEAQVIRHAHSRSTKLSTRWVFQRRNAISRSGVRTEC